MIQTHTFLPSLKVVRVCSGRDSVSSSLQDFTSNSLESAGQDLAIPQQLHDRPWVCTNFLGCILQCSWRILQCSQHDFVAAPSRLQNCNALPVFAAARQHSRSFRSSSCTAMRDHVHTRPPVISHPLQLWAGRSASTEDFTAARQTARDARTASVHFSTRPPSRAIASGLQPPCCGRHQNVTRARPRPSSTLAVSRLSPHGFLVLCLICLTEVFAPIVYLYVSLDTISEGRKFWKSV